MSFLAYYCQPVAHIVVVTAKVTVGKLVFNKHDESLGKFPVQIFSCNLNVPDLPAVDLIGLPWLPAGLMMGKT